MPIEQLLFFIYTQHKLYDWFERLIICWALYMPIEQSKSSILEKNHTDFSI